MGFNFTPSPGFPTVPAEPTDPDLTNKVNELENRIQEQQEVIDTLLGVSE